MTSRTRGVWGIALAVVAAVLALSLVVVERERREDARRGERAALSRYLAVAATQRAQSDPELAMLLALEAYRLVEDLPAERAADARRALLHTGRASEPLRVVLRGHRAPVSDVAVSPDGRLIASADSRGSVRLWSVAKRRQVGSLEGRAGGTELVFDPAGRWLAAFTSDGHVSMWRKPWTATPRRWRAASGLWSLAFSPDGRTVATGGGDGVRLRRSSSGATVGPRLTRQQTLHVAFASPNRLVVVGTGSGVEVFDVQRARRTEVGFPRFCADRRCSRVFVDDVAGGLLSPDARTLGVVGVHGVVGFHDFDGPPGRLPALGGDEVGLFAFSPDSRTVAVADSPYGVIRLHDLATLRPDGRSVAPHNRRITSAAFLPDGSELVVGGEDGTVRVVSVPRKTQGDGDPLWRDTGSTPLEPIVSPDGRVVVTATPAGVVRVADARRPGSRTRLAGRADFVELSPDGTLLVTADRDRGLVTVWDAVRAVPAGPPLHGELYPIGFDGDERVLFSDCCSDRVGLVLWRSGFPPLETPSAFPPGEDAWGGAVFSRDGRTVAVTTYEDTSTGDFAERIRLWDVERLLPLGRALPGGAGGFDVAFAPNGDVLAYSDNSRRARIWDVRNARPLSGPLAAGDGPLGFSPDGTVAGTAITEPFTAQPADGRTVTSGVEVGGAWLSWDLADWRTRTCDVVRRDLTPAEWRRFLPSEPYRPTCP